MNLHHGHHNEDNDHAICCRCPACITARECAASHIVPVDVHSQPLDVAGHFFNWCDRVDYFHRTNALWVQATNLKPTLEPQLMVMEPEMDAEAIGRVHEMPVIALRVPPCRHPRMHKHGFVWSDQTKEIWACGTCNYMEVRETGS